MSLNLPKPVNTYAGQDELRNTSSNGNGNGMEEEAEYRAPRMSDRYKSTMIYPPKEMRSEFLCSSSILSVHLNRNDTSSRESSGFTFTFAPPARAKTYANPQM